MSPKKVAWIVALSILVLAGLLGLIAFLDRPGKDTHTPHDKTVTINGEKYIQNNTKNYLIFGIDDDGKFESSGSYYNTNMCDFITILNINNNTKEYALFEINRDSMVDVITLGIKASQRTGTSYRQIAYAFTQGDGLDTSAKNVLNTVCELMYNINIKEYMAMKLPAINIINNSIGGVDITLEDDQDLSAVNPEWTPGANIHLDGDETEEFVRARKTVSDGTNESRMKRQTQYLEAFINQVSKVKEESSEDSAKLLANAFLEAGDYLKHNIVSADFDEMFDTFKDYKYLGSFTPEGRVEINENNNALFYIDQSSFDELMIKLFFRKNEQ